MFKRIAIATTLLIICFLVVVIFRPSLYEKRQLQLGGGNIVYKVAGEGEVVVLLHGFASMDYLWELTGLFGRLADDYRVVSYDARGHGDSLKPDNSDSYGMYMVSDLVALLDQLGIEKAYLVGHSMGGLTALKFASMYPERALGVVSLGIGWLPDGPFAKQLFGSPYKVAYTNALKASFSTLIELLVTDEEIEALRVPYTAIIGTEDRNYESTILPLREVRPDITIIEVEGRGHTNLLWWSGLADVIESAINADQTIEIGGAFTQ